MAEERIIKEYKTLTTRTTAENEIPDPQKASGPFDLLTGNATYQCPLSDRQLEEVMQGCGVAVDRATFSAGCASRRRR